MDFEQALKEVIWRLVTEGGISYRRIKLSFGLDDDALEELRRELIGIKRLAADVDGERLIWAPDGRTAQPERTALSQPMPALRLAERPPAPAADRDLPSAERRHLTVMFCDLTEFDPPLGAARSRGHGRCDPRLSGGGRRSRSGVSMATSPSSWAMAS